MTTAMHVLNSAITKCPDRVAHDLSRYDAPNCYASIDALIDLDRLDMRQCLDDLATELCIYDHETDWGDEQ